MIPLNGALAQVLGSIGVFRAPHVEPAGELLEVR
jgi:hypothetical protein